MREYVILLLINGHVILKRLYKRVFDGHLAAVSMLFVAGVLYRFIRLFLQLNSVECLKAYAKRICF